MGLLSAFFAEVVLVAYRGVKEKTGSPIKGLPDPADFAAAIVVYGTLSLLADTQLAPVVTVFGWGLVVATFMNLWTPKSPTHLGTTKKGTVVEVKTGVSP